MSELERIESVRVYPGIGIARVGNAREAFYFSPEVPGEIANEGESYRDEQGRVKRQACRFRIYGLDKRGRVVRELTAADADITWRVEVANVKAGWYAFANALDLPDGMAIAESRRNGQYRGPARRQLDIVPGGRVISGCGVQGAEYSFNTGRFFESQVYLGELRTDDAGRLIVLPGRGHSAPKLAGTKPQTFANNDDWHDDVCDGPVRATVAIRGGKTLEAEPGYVVVTPPDFGPGIQGPVTMGDVVRDTYIRELGWIQVPDKPSFARDVWPVFEHLAGNQWVNDGVNMMIGHNSPANPYDPEVYRRLASTAEEHRPYRSKWLSLFRDPSAAVQEPVALPPFYGSAFGEFMEAPQAYLSVTVTQYEILNKWAAGDFEADAPALEDLPPVPGFDSLDPEKQCEALDRVGLHNCLGDAFHPGIEMTWIMRRASMWKSPYRLNLLGEGELPEQDYGEMLEPEVALGPNGPLNASGPGSITRYMGVPWQTDEASCASGYNRHYYTSLPSFWAPRVPNQVISRASYSRLMDEDLPIGQRLKHFDYREDWYRDIQGGGYLDRIANMVSDWWMLGIVEPRKGPADARDSLLPPVVHVEEGRCARLTGQPVDHGCQGMTYQFFDPNLALIEKMENLDAVPTEAEEGVKMRLTAAQAQAPKPQDVPSPLRGSLRRDQR